MKKIISIYIAFIVVSIQVTAQNIPGDRMPLADEIKTLLSELKNSNPGIAQVETILNLSAYYLSSPGEEDADLDMAMQYADQGRKLSLSINYPDGYNEAMLLMGNTFREGGKMDFSKIIFDSAIVNITRIYNLSKTNRQPEREARALRQLGFIHLVQGPYDVAEQEFLDLITLYKANGFRNLHYTYERLFLLATITDNFDKALLYGTEMLKSMESTGDYAIAGSCYFDLGYLYTHLGKFQQGLDYYNLAIDFYKKRPNSILFDLMASKAVTMIKMDSTTEALEMIKRFSIEHPAKSNYEIKITENALGNCYKHLKQFVLAETHLQKAIMLEKKENPLYPYVYKTMGGFYTECGRYDLAKPLLEKCLATPIFPVTQRADLHYMMFKVDSAEGNYISALNHFKKYKTDSDLVFNETKSKQIEELHIQYDTEKKDKDIQLLTKQGLLQDTKLREAKLLRNVTLCGTALLIIIISLLYSRYRVKQRTNKKLEEQQKEIHQKNDSLLHLVNEKEWLLKEIHHRVKNNLQTVISLLNSQSSYLQNDAALSAIQDSKQRVHAMSLIHQKLYNSEILSSIDMPIYIRDLIEYLRDSFSTGQRIRFNMEIVPLELDVSQAVPVGLILNEAITNAIKYAFPDNREGIIGITLLQVVDNQYLLTISDNGTGMSADYDFNKSHSLGMTLMKGLSKDLDGTFTIESNHGTALKISFVRDVTIKRLSNFNSIEIAHE